MKVRELLNKVGTYKHIPIPQAVLTSVIDGEGLDTSPEVEDIKDKFICLELNDKTLVVLTSDYEFLMTWNSYCGDEGCWCSSGYAMNESPESLRKV